MSAIALEKTVGDLVVEQPARSRVFEQYGIDYCCGGKKPLAEACAAKGIDRDAVIRDLDEVDRSAPEPEVDWTQRTLAQICDRIEQTHHAYLREALPRLSFLTDKVARAHGDRDPRLVALRDVFAIFRGDLESHMAKEEIVLFPLCRQLTAARSMPRFHCGSVANPIRVMIAEHDDAGHGLEGMRELTDDFTPPAGACNTYRAMLQALEELEEDMHRHVHLENHVLFPKAIETEGSLAK